MDPYLYRILNIDCLIGGLVIEEITEEVETLSSANHKRSSTEYSAAQPQETSDASRTQSTSNTELLSTNSDRLRAFKSDPDAIRYVLFIKNCLLIKMLF